MDRPQSTPDRLVSLIRLRAAAGLEKYGVTVDRTDLTTPQWIDHAVEELIDGAEYLLRVKDHFEARPAADAVAALRAHLRDDDGYAISWHSNLAMAIYDCGVDHAVANRAAGRFMSMAFGIDNTVELCGAPKVPARASIRQIVAGALYDFVHSGKKIEHFIDDSGLAPEGAETAWKLAMESWARTEPLPDECESETPNKMPEWQFPGAYDAENMGKHGADDLGAGKEQLELERLAFEAWMTGHDWSVPPWSGTQYEGDDPHARRVRGCWAAWRDRAALANLSAIRADDSV